MSPDILEILRMACYQILYMENPHSAAVMKLLIWQSRAREENPRVCKWSVTWTA
ncbi:MAG: hypothetical protein ACLSCV_03150 [Acutalibacteraceae bacterium]